MKRILTLACAVLALATLPTADIADARRMGGGKSLGAQRQAAPQSPAPAPSAPAASTPSGAASQPVMPATPGAASAAKPAGAAAASGASRWLGPIAGLAAGLRPETILGDSAMAVHPEDPRSKDQAERILHGERPLNVLRGPKVRAFYRALRGDTDACVIDTHMARALGHRGRFPEGRAYERLSNRLRARATRAGLPVSYYQALVWIKQRGRAW